MRKLTLTIILLITCFILAHMLLLMMSCSSLQEVNVTECPTCGRLDNWQGTVNNLHTCETCGSIYKPVVLWVEFIEL